MIVLDANILIRAVLGRRVRDLLEKYSALGVRFFVTDAAFAEAQKHLPRLLERFGKPAAEATPSLELLRRLVSLVSVESFAPFEQEARLRLRRRDEEDWHVLAAALSLSCPIWTEDTDFFGTGCPIWTTSSVEIFLRAQLRLIEPYE